MPFRSTANLGLQHRGSTGIEIHTVKLGIGGTIPLETHPYTDQVLIVKTGTCSVRVNNTLYRLMEGAWIFVDAGEKHVVKTVNGCTLTSIYSSSEH